VAFDCKQVQILKQKQMANKQNKIRKSEWKRKITAMLLSEALLKGEVSPFQHDLRDEALHLFKRKHLYGTAKPRRKAWTADGRFVRHFRHSAIIRRADGKYILAPVVLGGGRFPKVI
jgi:hypothetical protein